MQQRVQITDSLLISLHQFSIVGRFVGFFRRRLVHLPSGMPLACLAVALLAPAPARAGCDYPTHIERTADDTISARGNTVTPKSDTQLPNKPCSCTGPTCSRQPLAPPPPSSVVSVNISQWGRLVPPFILVSPQAESSVSDEPLQLPSRHPSTIYHPPRLSF